MAHLTLLATSPETSDSDIKAIATTSRRHAMDLVARKYRDRLFHHAVYVVKDTEEAIDVVQEVFIKAMHEPRFFTPEFKMKAWLFRVTSNRCFNIVRDRKRRGAILETLPVPRSATANQDEVVFEDQQQTVILNAIQRLSKNHREILMLRYYSELSYAEISDVLGVKLGTVMSRLSRAKNHLMEVLAKQSVVDL